MRATSLPQYFIILTNIEEEGAYDPSILEGLKINFINEKPSEIMCRLEEEEDEGDEENGLILNTL